MHSVGLTAVGKLRGHPNRTTTERYARLARGHVRAAAGRIFGIAHAAVRGSREEDPS